MVIGYRFLNFPKRLNKKLWLSFGIIQVNLLFLSLNRSFLYFFVYLQLKKVKANEIRKISFVVAPDGVVCLA